MLLYELPGGCKIVKNEVKTQPQITDPVPRASWTPYISLYQEPSHPNYPRVRDTGDSNPSQ